MKPTTIGIVGARGHTGVELMRLITAHPQLEPAFVSSRALAGQKVCDQVAGASAELCYEDLDIDAVAGKAADVVILALPNEHAAGYVTAIEAKTPDTLIVDLSADHRFDKGWFYGLPELTRSRYSGQRRIANPGCYATAMQLGIAPLLESLAAPPQCFGVSGYSGAGTTPSDRSDPEKLRDNLMPYSLVGHLHEREVSQQLGVPVEFMPHVAPHFRGITMTINLWMQDFSTVAAIRERYREFFSADPLIRIVEDAPWVSRIAGKHHVEIGGFAVAAGSRRVVLVVTLDNLLKGAATQAIQNVNIACGFDELAGIPVSPVQDDQATGEPA